ncbi:MULTISPECIES: IS21-like element helper ATPase IstB [Dysgonomonas]|uniref:DNA replication protein DnaC n=1 Tax=Dysgonomonas hofstadii TaxID=637886 RepID=A0A840CQH5_9BACT|nr:MULTISPECIES: IS21-like element helper ATPase IstB [Dysgonomonas]MBB4038367.1 DNA replication protein DnaC [Dysgonomonas hofstadii]
MRQEVFNINSMQMENLNEKEKVFNYAKELKLPVMRDELDDFITQATDENWSYRVLICRLLTKEMDMRIEARRKQRIRLAGFPELKYLQELVRQELPKDAQTALPELETLEFIKDGRNIVFCGNPGTGKTHMSIGLGIKACLEGYTVFFTSVPRLLTQIRECRSQKSLRLLELRFQNYDMVICDEFGYVSCDKEGGELLFNHLSLRAGKKSTIITTNLAFDRWGEIVKDKVLVAAMVDRLTHKAYLINMNGQSYRVKETKKMLQPNEE